MNTAETVADIEDDQAESFLRWLIANPHADTYAIRAEYYALNKTDRARITKVVKAVKPLGE